VDAQAVLAEIAAWGREHRRATLAEIEDAVDERLGRLRQQLVEEQIAAHGLAEEVPSSEPWVCPDCGEVMRSHGTKPRTLRTKQGGALELERTYWWCPRCRAGLFPPG
jgi:rubrerythrin